MFLCTYFNVALQQYQSAYQKEAMGNQGEDKSSFVGMLPITNLISNQEIKCYH